jgi:hypothetical protein
VVALEFAKAQIDFAAQVSVTDQEVLELLFLLVLREGGRGQTGNRLCGGNPSAWDRFTIGASFDGNNEGNQRPKGEK